MAQKFVGIYAAVAKIISFNILTYDSQTTIARAEDKTYNGKKRYICFRHNMAKQYLNNEVIILDVVRSEGDMVDHFTKPRTIRVIYGV